MSKITIIGTGSVGSTIAYCATVMGFTDEIVLIDINSEKAMGEALDIRQGVSFCKPTKIYAGSYSDATGSDIVIITSGIARKPGQTRLELTQTNVNILKSVADNIVKFNSWGITPMVGWQFNEKFCVGVLVGANYASIDMVFADEYEHIKSSINGFGLEYGSYFSYTYKLINFQIGVTNVKGGFINIGVKM